MNHSKIRQEINWITNVKAVCIILVFLSHVSIFYGSSLRVVRNLMEPFYVNAFFFVSGYLLFWKQLSYPSIEECAKEYIVKGKGRILLNNIFFRIIIPSVIFSCVLYFPKKVVGGGSIDSLSLITETIGGCTYWFTSALVVAEMLILLLLLFRIANIWFYFIVSALLAMLGKYLDVEQITLIDGLSSAFPWMYKHGLIATVYLALGGIYWKYEDSINRILHGWPIIALAVIYVLSTILIYDKIECTTSACTINLIGVLVSVIGTLLLISLCKVIPNLEYLRFIGNKSIGFYFLSGGIPMIISAVFTRLFPINSDLIMVSAFVLSVIVAYAIVYVLERWLPFVFDIRLLRNK